MRSQGERTYDRVSTLIRRDQRPETRDQREISLSHSLSLSLSLPLCKDTACVNLEEGVHQESDFGVHQNHSDFGLPAFSPDL